VASEYFGPELSSGEPGPGGTLHQDLQRLSFATGSFDLVVSTDVLEHVPDPYRAHDEIRRVLRPGGHHVFTVPYEEGALLDDVRATLAADGSVVLLAEPLYHGDPVRPQEGALVYTIFGLEMVVRLARLGMETAVHRLWDPARGLVGPGAVFDSVRRE
jgi:SAM-dependent methyltransferase